MGSLQLCWRRWGSLAGAIVVLVLFQAAAVWSFYPPQLVAPIDNSFVRIVDPVECEGGTVQQLPGTPTGSHQCKVIWPEGVTHVMWRSLWGGKDGWKDGGGVSWTHWKTRTLEEMGCGVHPSPGAPHLNYQELHRRYLPGIPDVSTVLYLRDAHVSGHDAGPWNAKYWLAVEESHRSEASARVSRAEAPHVEDLAVVTSKWGSYFQHSVLYSLPLINMVLPMLQQRRDVKVLVDSEGGSFTKEVLLALGDRKSVV